MRKISKAKGHNTVMAIGIMLFGFVAAPFAIDVPTYFAVQQQLQTAVDAAALAGAAKLPYGESRAERAAYAVAQENHVQGKSLEASQLTYSYQGANMGVRGQVDMPTVTHKMLCALGLNGSVKNDEKKKLNERTGQKNTSAGGSDGNHCNGLLVTADARAVPAARDTILVIDTSSSMDDLGNNRPFADVRTAAHAFVDELAAMRSQNVDRIGLVQFNQTSKLESGLISQDESPRYSLIKSKLNSLKLFSGSGWNTNYETGLKTAVDELEKSGRKNSVKTVIFLTDGLPNTPGPSDYYLYSRSEPYKKCTDIVENSPEVRALCKPNSKGQTVCPKLPSPEIKSSMISSSAQSCALKYTDHMTNVLKAQADRAKSLDITIHTISITDKSRPDNAHEVLRRMIKDDKWDPKLLEYMANTTEGEQFESANYDSYRIRQIFETVAKDIRVVLSK